MTGMKRKSGRKRTPITNCPHIDKDTYAHGMCRNCYATWKYHNDPVFREKKKAYLRASSLKYFRKHSKENPDFYRKKSEKYRKKYPDKFRFIQTMSLFKRLTPIYRQRFLEQNHLKQEDENN